MAVKDDPPPTPCAAMAARIAATTALPHAAAWQRSFGGHDTSSVTVHAGARASAALDALGARAYTTGNQVSLPGAQGPRPAAHEAAHVVQQRRGHATPAPPSDQAAEALAEEIARSAAAPHQARVVVTPSAGPTTPSKSLGAAYAVVKNLANVEQAHPAGARDKSAR